MEETYLTEVITLNRQTFREDDLQATVYSRDRGKLFLIARGGKKAKSKLAAHLEPLCRTEIMVVRGWRYDYAGSAVSVDCHRQLKSDYDKISAAMLSVKKIVQTVREGVPDDNLFMLLRDFLKELNTGVLNPALAAAFFSLKFLALSGFGPELYHCVSDRKKIAPGGNRFDFVKSGIVCPHCRASAGSLPITDDSIKIMRLVINEDFGQLKKVKTSVKIDEEIIRLADFFYKHSIN